MAEPCYGTGNSEQVAGILGCELRKGVRLRLECMVYEAAELGGVNVRAESWKAALHQAGALHAHSERV